jgi:hypothetical protein
MEEPDNSQLNPYFFFRSLDGRGWGEGEGESIHVADRSKDLSLHIDSNVIVSLFSPVIARSASDEAISEIATLRSQ